MKRGEVPFVAIRVGRSNDPREVLGLARELKIQRATALGFLALWEEFVLEVGDARMGRVHGYGSDHLAAKLGWSGPPRRLVDALKRAGVLATHRGVLVHPYWASSTTGQYARMRAERRDTWRIEKERQRAAAAAAGRPEGVLSMSAGRLTDIDRKSDIDRSKEESGGQPPPAPPQAGGGLGASRWDWLRRHHKRPRNSQACMRLLGAMAEENWALCQWVVELAAGPWPRSLSRKKRVATMDSHRFLATEAFLELLPEWSEKLAGDQRRQKGPGAPPPAPPAIHTGISFVLAQMADPDLTEDEKEKIRARWAYLNPDNPAPWTDPAVS